MHISTVTAANLCSSIDWKSQNMYKN